MVGIQLRGRHMKRLFAVFRKRGPAWNEALPLEGQVEWAAHADFMDGLAAGGFVVLGGPLEGAREALLIVRAADEAEIERRIAADPWSHSGVLTTTRVHPWQLRLGALE